jgi:hypothetical protein
MKPTPERIKQFLAVGLMLVAVLLIVRVYRKGEARSAQATDHERGAKSTATASLEDPTLRLDVLERAQAIEYHGEGKNIFREREQVEIPKVNVSPLLHNPKMPPQMAHSAPPAPPPPMPINLTFYGFTHRAGEKPMVFLTQGGDIWIASEGDVVKRQYKIIRITPSTVEVEDLLNNNRQTLRLKQG